MATIKLADGRGELYQWDTGRKVVIDDETVKQVHYQNRFYGRTIDVDVSNGAAIIPDQLLQSFSPLVVFAWAGSAEDGYTKIEKTFEVHKRNKPAGYVFTPVDQKTLDDLQRQIGDLDDLATEAKENLVAAINEAARSGGGSGSMDLRVEDGYIQYSTDGGGTWQNLIAVAELKGDKGDTGAQGAKGDTGAAGADGITPTIGSNGNWYLGTTDTGKPSRGATGAKGDTGATGPQGPAGTPGKDGTGMDITGAAIGQIAKITAVDASGVPTAWSPVDMPTGGGGEREWALLNSGETQEVVKTILVDVDLQKINELLVFVRTHGSSDSVDSHFYWGVGTSDTAFGIPRSLHRSQWRLHALKLLKIKGKKWFGTAGYGFTSHTQIDGGNVELEHAEGFKVLAGVENKIAFGAYYYGDTELVAGTAYQVWGR